MRIKKAEPQKKFLREDRNVNTNELNFTDLTNFVITSDLPELKLKQNDISKTNDTVELTVECSSNFNMLICL